jgi:flagellar hook-length control protein FliK
VRDAIEAAMPRLREMLADSGIMLGNTMVGAESFQQQQQQQASAKNSGGGGGAGGARDEVANGVLGQVAGGVSARVGKGMVDTFV